MIENNFLYVDKTRYIELLEKESSEYQFFIRPRRFGKSLFISMLDNYYDINKKEKFDKLFGNLYIGKNPTPGRNSYLILRFSFAGIVTSESKERLIKSFDNCVTIPAKGFVEKYSQYLKVDSTPDDIRGADGLYMIESELEVESGYVDITLTKDVRWEKWITY